MKSKNENLPQFWAYALVSEDWECMRFFTAPLHSQYSIGETSAAMFYIDFLSSVWLQLVFHFGTENREEQLKKASCRSNKRQIRMLRTRGLIKFKYRATLKVSFFLPSMWKFLAPPTMLRAKCGLGLWIERSAEKLKNRKWKKLLKRFRGKWWLHRRSPQCSARKSFTLFIVVLSASRTYLWYLYCLFEKVVLHLEFMYDITRTANPQAIIWQGIWLIEQISRCLHSLDRLAATSFKVDLAKSVGRMFLKWVKQIRSRLIICEFF